MKKLLSFFTLFFILPNVSAASATEWGFIKITSVVFGPTTTMNEAVVKILFFTILFALFSKGLARTLKFDPTASHLLAMIVAFIGVRFMPNVWILGLGKLIWVTAVLIIPYMLAELVFKEWSLMRIILLSALYLGVYLLFGGNIWGFGFMPTFMADMSYYYYVYRFQTVLVVSFIILYLSFKLWKRENRLIRK